MIKSINDDKWFGIQTPDNIVWWITNDEHDSWMTFFCRDTSKGGAAYHHLPIAEAIRAYESIGYKCVELEVTIKEKKLFREECITCDHMVKGEKGEACCDREICKFEENDGISS